MPTFTQLLYSIALCLCLTTTSAQITFELLESPDDFSVEAVRKSPTGEYFIQAANDRNSIYTSPNGVDWTQEALPRYHTLSKMQFLDDGTPVLQRSGREHLIRRNGDWHILDLVPTTGNVEASFAKEDTLFVYERNAFGYSMDKGESFEVLFTFDEGLVDHNAHLFKFEDHYVLHHTAGATDYLSIFNNEGTRVLYTELDLAFFDVFHNSCGEVLFAGYNDYYLLEDGSLNIEFGDLDDLLTDSLPRNNLSSRGANYYCAYNGTLYKASACSDFNWLPHMSSNWIAEEQNYYITDDEEDVILYNSRGDYYREQMNGAATWEKYSIDIDQAYVYTVDEVASGHQVALTPNTAFTKTTSTDNWGGVQLDSSDIRVAQFSPNGDLYLQFDKQIFLSQDNGQTFTDIPMPDLSFFANVQDFEVLDDQTLLLTTYFEGEYYTLNNGDNWSHAPYNPEPPEELTETKLVGNHILMTDRFFPSFYPLSVTDIHTNELTNPNLGLFTSTDDYSAAITDDGFLYIHGRNLLDANPTGLYRYDYRYNGSLEFLGQFEGFISFASLLTSGTELYSFGNSNCYWFDGSDFIEHEYIGLPSDDGNPRFVVSENEHLFAIFNNHTIYRSTEPLSYPTRISGNIHQDTDQDCLPNPEVPALDNWQVKIESEDYTRIRPTNENGAFNFSAPEGTYTLSTQPINPNWALCEPAFDVTISSTDPEPSRDFQAQPLNDCAALDIDFSAPFLRRCFDNYYSVRVRNTGPSASAGTILRMELDPFFEVQSASIPYNQVSDTLLEFDLGVLELNDEVNFNVFFLLSCEAELGAEHCLSGSLLDDNLCSDGTSLVAASYTECQENIGAFDPNDKRIFNAAGQEVEQLDKDEYLYYHIRFQNTGTDTAFTVRVLDTLSEKLDLNTLEMLSASHPYEYTVTDLPALEVIFNDILLPDSNVNELASHGFFKFRVKPLPEFDYGTMIPNSAAIYFDFNEPIITNTAVLTIKDPVYTREATPLLTFGLFPNPTREQLRLDLSASDLHRIDHYEIVNHLGQSVRPPTLLQEMTIQVGQLPAGSYELLLRKGSTLVGRSRFVKM